MANVTTEKMNDGFFIVQNNRNHVGFHSECAGDSFKEKNGVVFHWYFTQSGELVCSDTAVYEDGDMIAFSSYPDGFKE